jgi:lipopolysaccharide export system protein LptA
MRRLALALTFVTLGPVALAAQERQCSFTTGGFAESSTVETGVVVIRDPFIFSCDDGVVLSASSGRLNQLTDEAHFVGDVFFQDSTNTLRAAEATYNAQTAHLVALGDVRFEDKAEGSTLQGPNLEYFRATDARPVARMTATERPTLLLYPETAAGGTQDPIRLVGDRVEMEGSSRLTAFGGVVITRTDLDARGEEVLYDSAAEELELRRSAVIQSEGRELAGETILARLADGRIEYVRSTTAASMESEDLDVAGEDLQLFFVGEALERAVAVGARDADPRVTATARAEAFELTADSLDARFTEQRLDQVIAIGDARGVTRDSATAAPSPVTPTDTTGTAPVSDPVAEAFASDWIRGDTIIGFFAPTEREIADINAVPVDPSREIVVQGADQSNEVDLERIVAIGSAESVYRLSGTGGQSAERTNLNFLVGQRIELEMGGGEMRVARVEGLQYGIYLEPETTGAEPPAVGDVTPVPEVPAPNPPPAAGPDQALVPPAAVDR